MMYLVLACAIALVVMMTYVFVAFDNGMEKYVGLRMGISFGASLVLAILSNGSGPDTNRIFNFLGILLLGGIVLHWVTTGIGFLLAKGIRAIIKKP